MITGRDFVSAAAASGTSFFAGVPCSFLTPLLNGVINASSEAQGNVSRMRYVGATSEGEAVAIAAGAWLTGRNALVMGQNSGFGNMVNPITSLLHPMRIPLTVLLTWRGEPGRPDEPQHEMMGQITLPLCRLLGLETFIVPPSPAEVADVLRAAADHGRATGASSALILPDGIVASETLTSPPNAATCPGVLVGEAHGGAATLSRAECLEMVVDTAPDGAALVATTGKCARELFTIADGPRNLYMVGSMGCASAVGLGAALNTDRPVVVLDGDGAALMKLGNLATVGALAPRNLIHVVLDNGVHDSTGGQPTAAANTDFAAVAHACGYRTSTRAGDVAALSDALRRAFSGAGPHFVHVRIRAGSLTPLGRPTISPAAVARRFREYLSCA